MTLARLAPIEPWSLAALLANDATTGMWAVICAPIESLEALAEDMREQMGSLFDTPVVLVQIKTAPDVVQTVVSHADAALVVLGLQDWDEHEWARLDLLRSRLARRCPTLLVLDERSVKRVSSHAPNLWSWIGGSAWALGDAARDVE